MIRAPYQIQRSTKPLTQDPIAIVLGYQKIAQTIQELENLKAKHDAEHQRVLNDIVKEHNSKMAEMDTHIRTAKDHITNIQKGLPGRDGVDGVSPDPKEIAKTVMAQIRQPKDGETPVINLDVVAQKAAKLIKVPDPKQPTELDPEKVAKLAIKTIIDKKLLKSEHIDGLNKELTSYRAQLAGKHYGENTMVRGGGDTVAAGSNITIAVVNGVKTISASGGSGFTELTATETPDGIITVFTFAAASAKPSYLVLDNVWVKAVSKKGTTQWTWNAGAKQATLVTVPPPNEDAYAIV